jgi:hypothetical protein
MIIATKAQATNIIEGLMEFFAIALAAIFIKTLIIVVDEIV